MQSLCTFTTSSDTFCTAVNEKTQTQWGVWGVELGHVELGHVGRLWERGEGQKK